MSKLLNFKPILFQPEMVKANLDGRKTETRRTKGLDIINQHPDDWQFFEFETDPEFITGVDKRDNDIVKTFPGLYAEFAHIDGDFEMYRSIKCPYGNVGDILWVRETFYRTRDGFIFKTDKTDNISEPHASAIWKPSIHMPKQACRIFLLLKEVKVERLQDISDEGAIAEGVRWLGKTEASNQDYYTNYCNEETVFFEAKCSFQSLWQSINGSDSWHENPWLWVLKYEVLSTTGIDELRENLLHHLINNHENVWEPIAKLNALEITIKSISAWLATHSK